MAENCDQTTILRKPMAPRIAPRASPEDLAPHDPPQVPQHDLAQRERQSTTATQ
jgi:hypothetical protein